MRAVPARCRFPFTESRNGWAARSASAFRQLAQALSNSLALNTAIDDAIIVVAQEVNAILTIDQAFLLAMSFHFISLLGVSSLHDNGCALSRGDEASIFRWNDIFLSGIHCH